MPTGPLIATIAAVAMLAAACAPDPGPPESRALFDKLERGPSSMPLRETLGIPDAQFVCAFGNVGRTTGAVDVIREGFDDPVADQGPIEELPGFGDGPDWIYVAAPSGERVIIGKSRQRYVLALGSDMCVRAETGRFERLNKHNWVVRGDNGRLKELKRLEIEEERRLQEERKRRNAQRRRPTT